MKDLDSPSPSVRFSAAKAPGSFDNQAVREALLDQLEKAHLHIFVKLEAAAGLARFGLVEGWNFLATTLTSEFRSNRLEAVIVLAEINAPGPGKCCSRFLPIASKMRRFGPALLGR